MTYRGRLVAGRPPVIEGNAGSNPAPGLRATSCTGGAVEGSAARVVARFNLSKYVRARIARAWSDRNRLGGQAGGPDTGVGDPPPLPRKPRIAHAFHTPTPAPGDRALCGAVFRKGRTLTAGEAERVERCVVCRALDGEEVL